MQFHKIRAGLTGYRKTTHDHYVLTPLDEVVVSQALVNHSDQVFGAALHRDAIRPDTPPESKLTVDMFGRSIGQNRDAGAVF
jgi:hypothetical protein